MCGIFGWIKPFPKMETALNLVKLFRDGMVETQERGEDAAGFYSLGTGVVKDAISAEEFVDDKIPNSLSQERFVIGHCRQASSKYLKDEDHMANPANAQPFESKNFVLAHNGTLEMSKLKDFNYTSSVDSENIIAYAEKTSVRNAIASIDGGSSLVLYDKKNKKLLFWTNGDRPFAICLFADIIFFASTKKILLNTLKPKTTLQVFHPEINFATIYENELLEFDLQKSKFARRGEIKRKVSKEASQAVKSQINASYYPSPVTSFSKPLPKGCPANPHSPQPSTQQEDLFQDEDENPYGQAARSQALETVNNNKQKLGTRSVHIDKNGNKIVTYTYNNRNKK